MSAYQVSPDHINVLVSYFIGHTHSDQLWCKIRGEYTHLTKDNAPHFAYELWKENVKSINARYDETHSDEMYQFFNYPFAKDAYKPLEIAGMLDGLEYQSCEHETYFQSEAWHNMCSMRKHLLRQMAELELDDETLWTIDTVRAEAR